jgi:hypothetical protein
MSGESQIIAFRALIPYIIWLSVGLNQGKNISHGVNVIWKKRSFILSKSIDQVLSSHFLSVRFDNIQENIRMKQINISTGLQSK